MATVMSDRADVNSTEPPDRPKPQSRWPQWVWWAGGTLLLAIIGLILLLALPADPGFTLIVRGAPAGDIYIDNVRHGVMTSTGDQRVATLKAGKRLVRVSQQGFADFNTTVTGTDGETRTLIAQLVPTEVKASLPAEIDYQGAMVLIPAGEFIMGDDLHQPNEKPAHKVMLPDYYIDKYEVTNAQYRRFCEATGRPLPTNPWWDGQYANNSPDAPVVGVSWNDAAAYARWAGKRLVTEVEWEKAAAWQPDGKKKRMWPWGDEADITRANLNSNHPTTMNSYAAGTSAYGVHDLAGNAAEWVDAYYQPYQGNTLTDKDYGVQNRVVRGGSFRSSAEDARTTRRLYHAPEFKAVELRDRSWLIGFRCAVSATDAKLQLFLSSQK